MKPRSYQEAHKVYCLSPFFTPLFRTFWVNYTSEIHSNLLANLLPNVKNSAEIKYKNLNEILYNTSEMIYVANSITLLSARI